jgi:hypothetical protein
MSAKKQSKRKKKIATVMREFKAGDLKSGGSGRKVTNPKQAIAIALSEANAMNQGGMMYNEIMNRPMFQTPQMREGSGIMAGVAPIRGYAEGDLVEDDDSMIASLLSQVEELPEVLSNLTMDDAISYVKQNPEILIYGLPGVGLGTAAGLKFGPGLVRGATSLARRLISKKNTGKSSRQMTEGDIAAPQVRSRKMMGQDIGVKSSPKKASDAAKKADAPEADVKKRPGRLRRALGSKTALATGVGGLASIPVVQDLVKQGLISLDDLTGASDLYEEYMPEFIKEGISPTVGGERAELTEYAGSRLPDVTSARKEGFPEQPKAPPPPPPDPTFLDMLKGAGTQFKDFLQDPANQYAFAKAGQASEGIAPRNFASDFALGKEEYKQLEAQRENDTALMRNYQFLKETTDLSDKEIISRLSGEATARDEFLTLFSEAIDTAGSVTPEQIAQFEGITGYTLPEEARVRLGVAAPPSAVVE